ncbi:MAG: VTT domain-containing protein [Chloroflexi bacterium]|jgi:uncharacterized membrane protein YdjX (TVP38/TMEM64 family)|nr:VTT domain-containing protein [Chloroflexota bacterium]
MQIRSVPRIPTDSSYLNAGRLITFAVIAIACIAPVAIQKYVPLSPEIIGTIGIPAIIILGFLGSVTVMIPVPVLSLVFAGAGILNPVFLVIAAAIGITAGMAVCYVLGKKGHSKAVAVTERSQQQIPRRFSNFYSWSTENVGLASFLLAATPNPIFDYAGFIAGAGRVDIHRFLAGTFVGKLAQTSVIVFLGQILGERVANFL